MGLGIGLSSCGCSRNRDGEMLLDKIIKTLNRQPTPPLPNPDPKNFRIRILKQIGKNVVLVVQYPDCTNYEGVKVMVYKNTSELEIETLNKIDPHFCENCLSPFARFEPTPEGIHEACELAKRLK